MKVVILAGGLGTRLSEYTDVVPKPMIDQIHNKSRFVYKTVSKIIKMLPQAAPPGLVIPTGW